LNGNQIKDIVKLYNDDLVFLTDNFKITKVDSDFDTIWHQDHLDTTGNRLNKLQPTFDGGFIAAGSGPDGNLYKLNSLGDTLWTRRVPSKRLNCVALVNGGYAFVGAKEQLSNFTSSYVLKTDVNGDSLWSKVYQADSTDRELELIYTLSNDDYLLLGSKAPFQSNFLRMDYRIQVDSLGNCGSVGFEELDYQSITLSPNPNTGYFSIHVDPSQLGSVYGIFDNLGRLIQQGFITEKTQDFDFSGQPRGMYTIKVSNQDEMKVRKMIIQ
jgi:hypothetical protein